MTQRFLIKIEYDGAPFVGWQRQANGISVQQVIEEAATQLCGHAIKVQGPDEPILGGACNRTSGASGPAQEIR